jgi:sec-independent protein translocase protein TatC
MNDTDLTPTGETDLVETSKAPAEMAFLDHLEELRWRILKALAAILLGAVVCFVFSDSLLKILTYPYDDAVRSIESDRSSGAVEAVKRLLAQWMSSVDPRYAVAAGESVPAQLPESRRLQALKPMTYFFISLQIALIGGFIFALPVVFYQFWQFVAPGLLTYEKRLAIPVVGASVGCFCTGAAAAYWIVLPLGLRFFLALEPPDMTSQWAVDIYVSFVLRLLLGFGIVFEMPVVSLILSRIGLLTPEYMRRIRRYAIIIIFILGAIFTPPDPLSQILMALPLLLLYEVSIWVSKAFGKDRQQKKPAA